MKVYYPQTGSLAFLAALVQLSLPLHWVPLASLDRNGENKPQPFGAANAQAPTAHAG